MNELCFTFVVLYLYKFLTTNFNKQKLVARALRQMLCLDYSNLQERRNISKLNMIATGH